MDLGGLAENLLSGGMPAAVASTQFGHHSRVDVTLPGAAGHEPRIVPAPGVGHGRADRGSRNRGGMLARRVEARILVHPRRSWSTTAVPLGAETAVRLRFRAAHALRFCAVLGGIEAPIAQGRRVREFLGRYEHGRYGIRWDLRDTRGGLVPPGVYAYQLVAGTSIARRKMVVIP